MELKVAARSETKVEAGYDCPCGCTPSVMYSRGSGAVEEGCCCGNHFVVGPGAYSKIQLQLKDGFHAEAEMFAAPWGDQLEAAWAIGPSHH